MTKPLNKKQVTNNGHKKLVLAYSGGLDTTYCLATFVDQGYEVHAVLVNTGGFSNEEIAKLLKKGKNAGAHVATCIDVAQKYYDECVRFLLAGNVLKNHSYPLSVSSERVFQALEIGKYALKIGADAVAHGSTGAGNDQFRFDFVFNAICPFAEIITPVRDLSIKREDEVSLLNAKGIAVVENAGTYSVNQGLWGTSVGGKETLTSFETLPEHAWPVKIDHSLEDLTVCIDFEQGHPKSIKLENVKAKTEFAHPVHLIQALEKIAAPYGVGRAIHVGDTILGIKGRVGFQAAAAIVLIEAHRTLEKHVLTKNQIKIKDQIASIYGELLHGEGFLDPSLDDMKVFFESTQKRVTGKVKVKLYPRGFEILGSQSEFDLMDQSVAQYGETNEGWSGQEARHFGKILSTSMKIYAGKGAHHLQSN